MKTTEVVLRFLIADDGYLIRNKEDKTVVSEKVALSVTDNADNWEEVEAEIALQEKEEIEKAIEENLNELVNNTIES